jgi:hypothetical protein
VLNNGNCRDALKRFVAKGQILYFAGDPGGERSSFSRNGKHFGRLVYSYDGQPAFLQPTDPPPGAAAHVKYTCALRESTAIQRPTPCSALQSINYFIEPPRGSGV